MQRNLKLAMDLVRFSLSLNFCDRIKDYYCFLAWLWGVQRDACTCSSLNSKLLDAWFHDACSSAVQGSSVCTQGCVSNS